MWTLLWIQVGLIDWLFKGSVRRCVHAGSSESSEHGRLLYSRLCDHRLFLLQVVERDETRTQIAPILVYLPHGPPVTVASDDMENISFLEGQFVVVPGFVRENRLVDRRPIYVRVPGRNFCISLRLLYFHPIDIFVPENLFAQEIPTPASFATISPHKERILDGTKAREHTRPLSRARVKLVWTWTATSCDNWQRLWYGIFLENNKVQHVAGKTPPFPLADTCGCVSLVLSSGAPRFGSDAGMGYD